MIMDGTAVANCYRVHIEKGSAPIMASACTHGSGVCLGATEINTYAPGTSVIVMTHDNLSDGYILGAVPNILDIGSRAYHDYISQASRKRVDDVHKKHIKQPRGGLLTPLLPASGAQFLRRVWALRWTTLWSKCQ